LVLLPKTEKKPLSCRKRTAFKASAEGYIRYRLNKKLRVLNQELAQKIAAIAAHTYEKWEDYYQ
jgi:hypothetical protein